MMRSKRQTIGLSLLVMLAAALAACGGGQQGAGANVKSPAGVSQAAGPLVPDFTVSTGAETSFSLSGHRGEIVLLYFSFPG